MSVFGLDGLALLAFVTAQFHNQHERCARTCCDPGAPSHTGPAITHLQNLMCLQQDLQAGMADEASHCCGKQPATVMHVMPMHTVRVNAGNACEQRNCSPVSCPLAAACYFTAQAGTVDIQVALLAIRESICVLVLQKCLQAASMDFCSFFHVAQRVEVGP